MMSSTTSFIWDIAIVRTDKRGKTVSIITFFFILFWLDYIVSWARLIEAVGQPFVQSDIGKGGRKMGRISYIRIHTQMATWKKQIATSRSHHSGTVRRLFLFLIRWLSATVLKKESYYSTERNVCFLFKSTIRQILMCQVLLAGPISKKNILPADVVPLIDSICWCLWTLYLNCRAQLRSIQVRAGEWEWWNSIVSCWTWIAGRVVCQSI